MASSSSSSSESWSHDVFLSLRGTDTRKTFVDHLFSALVQQGIYTYKDDETLPRGEAISPSLLKAIEESQIAVIIFSENYADSSWCLDELAYIMKCKDERGQIVMPIFYHIDPSEVRKQKGKYGEALAKHELENKKVESWRKALMDVGNLSGWEPKHIVNGHEAKCIKEIVDTISNRLCVAISSDDEDLIGMQDRLQDLISKLEMKSHGVVMVILDACGFHPIIGVKVLIQKALITVSEEGRFEMHDLIQEMGHYIVRRENPKNPELYSRVWLEEDVIKICAMDATMENERIEALIFNRYLDVPPSLPQVVANMKKLRWISCVKYPATSISREFQPMKLCCLTLKCSWLQQLWEGYKHLPNLKVLDLGSSRNLVSTPDVDGLPCLERLILNSCTSLEEIHPSIGYHERLKFVDMEYCISLQIFPPIIRMKKLETLLLSYCSKLCKFPEIQTNMDNLIELSLRESGIEIVPSSIGRYCTNLLYLDLRRCIHLKSIEGNFHLLEHLKGLYLEGCEELKNMPAEGLFDVECCLQVLSSFKNLHRGMVSMKHFGFSTSLRRLNLRECNLVDGDIFSVFSNELSNLQALDLSQNDFSRLHSSLSQLPRLKFLNLSDCLNLVELPDLPSSLSILIAEGCDSLDVGGEFPTNLKWLWKVSLSASKCNGERVLQSMLQGNAIEDYFISIRFGGAYIPIRGFSRETFTLKLPWNWYNEYSGFLVYVDHWFKIWDVVIIMKDRENEDGVSVVSYNEDEERDRVGRMCYISFNSLRNTTWWNSTHTTISFFIRRYTLLKVELVPRRNDSDDSVERAKDTTYYSGFWDEEARNGKMFEIVDDSRSSIKILWRHGPHEDMFTHAS